MNRTAVLVCSGAGVDSSLDGLPVAVVDDLCHSPAAAAKALGELGATRAVLGLCDTPRPASGLVAALRAAGAEPFGIETVSLGETSQPLRLLAAAAARLGRLAPDEPGRPVLSAQRLNRRALFSRNGVIDYRPVAVVDEALCPGSARCGLCVDACPVDAIDSGNRHPRVAVTACTACADCVRACPTGAIHLSGAAPAQIAAQLEQLLEFADGLVLACAQAEPAPAPDGWALVVLPSLAVVTPGWILQIRTRGREVRLAGCGGPCCAGAAATEAFARRVLGDRRWPVPARPTPLPLSEPAATVEAYERIETTAAAPAIESDVSPLGLMALDTARCTLCGACATSCPTDALQLDEDEDETVLRYEHSACNGCGRCLSACPEDALDLTRALSPSLLERGRFPLLASPHEICSECGASLPPLPLRRRLGELLPDMAGSHLGMCAACARRAGAATSDHAQTGGED